MRWSFRWNFILTRGLRRGKGFHKYLQTCLKVIARSYYINIISICSYIHICLDAFTNSPHQPQSDLAGACRRCSVVCKFHIFTLISFGSQVVMLINPGVGFYISGVWILDSDGQPVICGNDSGTV